MTARFDARIAGQTIHCTITVDAALMAPVFCFSLMGPVEVVSGGKRIGGLGGFAEVALPDLSPGEPHEVVVRHRSAGYAPANRAYLPHGPYLRHADGILPLPPVETGIRTGTAPKPAAAGADDLMLCPPPTAHALIGSTVEVRRGFACDHEAFRAVAGISVGARTVQAPFLSPRGLPVTVTTDGDLPPEGYFLDIAADGIRLAARDRAGVFYGAITLRTLQITHGARLPLARIADAPRFGWRGQHLDTARNFLPVDTILALLELMALMKLNRFHWHFADDEAFRLEVSSYPALWQKTAFRGEGELFPGVRGGGVRAGGSYSTADVARIVAHAQRLGIEVMPEIEMPSHAYAMTRLIPDLRDPDDTSGGGFAQGYRGNTINPAVETTWEVLPALADEIAGLFPFRHIHLGCDELPSGAWKRSPAIDALKDRFGFETRDDIQGWMMARMARHLVANGVRPAAWEEAQNGRGGGIGNGAILFAWSGQAPGVAAARAGYDVVMCPAQHVYLDMAHSADVQDWGARWAGATGLEDTVAWSPVPDGAEDIAPRIVGVQGNFWSEFTMREGLLWPMLLPRLLGVAAMAWSPAGGLDGPGLRRLADGYRAAVAGRWAWHHGA